MTQTAAQAIELSKVPAYAIQTARALKRNKTKEFDDGTHFARAALRR